MQADHQVIHLLHVLRGSHAVLHGPRLRQGLAEQRLDVRVTLSLVLTRLADGYNLIRQRVSRSIHQLVTIVLNPKKEEARLLRLAGLIDAPTDSSLKQSPWLLNRGGGGRLEVRYAVL